MRRAAGLALAALAACWSCAAPRPTEFVDIAFVPWIETEHYRLWDFDLAACRDTGDARVDDAVLRSELLRSIEAELGRLGYERAPGGEVDFRVHYELQAADGGDLPGVAERLRGRIFVRDVRTGRLVWRGERKAPVGDGAATREEVAAKVDAFVHELLQYTRELEDPERRPD